MTQLLITIVIAVLLDFFLGEPKKYHPLVGFGYIASCLEKKILINRLSALLQKICGFVALVLLLSIFVLPFYYLQQIPWLNTIIAAVILYFCIAAHSLKQHALAVYQALQQQDLELARQKVAMIVSRDCDKMQPVDVRRATIESVLENGADAVFAPLFWFIIAGCPGVVLYRLANTLDAMWGYKNQRYLHFGMPAARLDDILNFVPARLTALTYAVLGNTALAWHSWRTHAKLLDSPNAGVVMTSGAGSLGLQLGGAAYYHGQYKAKAFFGGDKPPENQDIYHANRLLNLSLWLWLLVIAIALFFFSDF